VPGFGAPQGPPPSRQPGATLGAPVSAVASGSLQPVPPSRPPRGVVAGLHPPAGPSRPSSTQAASTSRLQTPGLQLRASATPRSRSFTALETAVTVAPPRPGCSTARQQVRSVGPTVSWAPPAASSGVIAGRCASQRGPRRTSPARQRTASTQPLANVRSASSSYVPPPPRDSSSYVAPPLATAALPQAQGSWLPPRAATAWLPPSQNSWLPPHGPSLQTGSYVPPPTQVSYVPPAQGSYVPAPTTASYVAPALGSSYVPPVLVGNGSAPGSYLPPPSQLPAQTVQAVDVGSAAAASSTAGGCDEGERCCVGTEMNIGSYRLRCTSALGRGSFSEVWTAEILCGRPVGNTLEVALKDITCQGPSDLQQALFEVGLLERLQSVGTAGSSPTSLRMPVYLAHRVDRRSSGGWRVRLAMTRAPGEPLDAFLRQPAVDEWDAPNAVRRGCALATQLIRQLGPTLDEVSRHAWHRDVNSHNVLISDAIDGGNLKPTADFEETAKRASFWLIDFGLAVDTATWPSIWTTADVAGDCRYWPPSSFLMSFYGPDETQGRQAFCNQYKTRLDIVGLGLTALEILCNAALSTSHNWGEDGLRGSWRRLFFAWEQYRKEVTRWHTQIYRVFASGGNVGPMYRQLAQEHVVERIIEHIRQICSLLRACVKRAEDYRIQNLLQVLADMLDERSTTTLREAVQALGGPELRASAAPPQRAVNVPQQIGYAAAPRAEMASQPQPVAAPGVQWLPAPTGLSKAAVARVQVPTSARRQLGGA